MLPKRTLYVLAAVLCGFLVYTHLLTRSAVADQHAADVLAQKDARIKTLADSLVLLHGRTARTETLYVAAKAKTDDRARKTTDDADTAIAAVKATGDTAAIKAVAKLTMDLVLERRERGTEREAADAVIAAKTKEIGSLTEQLAAVQSRAEEQRKLDHRAVLREKARGMVTVLSASGGAAVGAVFGGPPGAAIGALVGGIGAQLVGR